jgi:hypothetical protein
MGRKSNLKKQRRHRKTVAEEKAAIGRERGCLICRQSDGGFSSREHILPESLGNSETARRSGPALVLDRGVVCDRCNNGVLAGLDEVLCDYFPIKARRTVLGVASKSSGKVPDTSHASGKLIHRDGQEPLLRFDTNGKFGLHETGRSAESVHLHARMQGGRLLTPSYISKISRSLLKIGLELAWLENGEAVLDSQFDHVRDAILGRPRAGFVAQVKEVNPAANYVSSQYQMVNDGDAEGMGVACEIFGVGLLTHSRLSAPIEEMPGDLVETLLFT